VELGLSAREEESKMKFSEALNAAIEDLHDLEGDTESVKKLRTMRGLARIGRVYVYSSPEMIARGIRRNLEVPEYSQES
jgi:hypothetical protein